MVEEKLLYFAFVWLMVFVSYRNYYKKEPHKLQGAKYDIIKWKFYDNHCYNKVMKIIRKFWYILAIVVILGILFLPRMVIGTTKSPKKQQYTTVKRHDVKETLTLSGKIDAMEKATLKFQTSGKLSWVGVKEGDKVSKYQALASLDQRDVKKTLEKKLNSYMTDRWNFDQTQDDYEGKIISDAFKRIIDKTQFTLNNSVLDVEISNLAIEYATLITPIEGIVTKIDAKNAGVNITPATAEFEVINPNSLYLSVTADQGEVTKIAQGLSGDITFDAFTQMRYVGTISAIGFTPKSGESSTVYEVKVTLANPTDTTFRIGMTADAIFTTRSAKDVLSVPSSAITTKNGKSYVQKLVRDKPVQTLVTLGEEYDSDRIILSGLSEGDVIND